MAEKTRIHILDPSGARSVEATIEAGDSIETLTRQLVNRFGYPEDRIGSRPVHYLLYHRPSGETLPSDATFADGMVKDGETLVIIAAHGDQGGPR